ncbi:class I SAM-dependent methyltransferase [Pendulispora rubella]|uniref:Class I SAM-dependent methyltransferase n=1 Tax=Pendulispora rubella TaxID=2741070 RepID=A0ABZ2KYV8_9BACT
MRLNEAVKRGVYAQKLLLTNLGVLRFSHSSRFELAKKLAATLGGKRLLDYGCGDGTFLGSNVGSFERGVGVEIDHLLVNENAQRFSAEPTIGFQHTSDIVKEPNESFDTIFCMEVLEHIAPENLDGILSLLHRLLAKDGTLVVSVPIEVGPSILAKQAYRAYAGRNIVDYQHRERYTVREMVKSVLARATTTLDRPVYRVEFSDGSPNVHCGHKGFNWRALRERLAQRLEVRETQFSPLPYVGSLINSQAWFLCSRRPGDEAQVQPRRTGSDTPSYEERQKTSLQ